MTNFDKYTYAETLVKNLNSLIEKKECTHRDVAIAIDVDDSALTKILKQGRKVSVSDLFLLADYFDVSVEQLVTMPKENEDVFKQEDSEKKVIDAVRSYIAKYQLPASKRNAIANSIISILNAACM